MNRRVELGCGLAGIGRPWGIQPNGVLEASDAMNFLADATDLGVHFFDTSPAYGLSEERLGDFLREMPEHERRNLIIATKMGEHWDEETGESYTDHTSTGLIRSIDTSVERLGQIDLLQIDQATPEALRNMDVHQAMEYAQRVYKVGHFGVSVSDVETAESVLYDGRFSHIQLPYNQQQAEFGRILDQAQSLNKTIIVNQPLQTGSVGGDKNIHPAQRARQRYDAFAFILERAFDGIVLTGTSNSSHLYDNLSAFERVRS